MNANLQRRIALIRTALEDDPNGITIGDLPKGLMTTPIELAELPCYCAFLRETHGARFGGVDFWTIEELGRNQYVLDELPEGNLRWLCVGQVLYRPLLLDKQSEVVRLLDLENEEDGLGRTFGHLDDFLSSLVGRGYKSALEVRHDDWVDLLDKLELD